MKLKACLHLHVKGDPKEDIKYDIFEVAKKAKELGFNVLATTCHSKCLAVPAKIDDLTIIRGIEARIEGKDVIILNTDEESEKIKTLQELRDFKIKNPQTYIFAPHPFFILPSCLGQKLIEYIDVFEGIEWNYFYNSILNPNIKGKQVARKFNKPVIGTSDVHFLDVMDSTYCVIESKSEEIPDIISALKQGKVELRTKSFSLFALIGLLFKLYKSTH